MSGKLTALAVIASFGLALGSSPVSSCASFDSSGDGTVAINELIAAVTRALNDVWAGAARS